MVILSKLNYFIVICVSLCLVLAIGGLRFYDGSPLIFTFFSLVFLFLLVDGIFRSISLAYTFLVIFLWLGFWLKLIAHLWLGYAYREPTGYFGGSSEQWDAVLLISSVGAIGVILTKYMFSKLAAKHDWRNVKVTYLAPAWYSSHRLWLWGMVWAIIIILPMINMVYGIFRVGLPPAISLPWPLTGLFTWFMGFGVILLVSTLVYWDHAIKKGWLMGYAGVLVESFLSAFSCLSRSVYLFHSVPYLYVLFTQRFQKGGGARKKMILSVLFLWGSIFVISLLSVMVFRYSHDPSINSFVSKEGSVQNKGEESPFSLDEAVVHLNRITGLLVDRWIGLEGLMAVSAYPEKSTVLFWNLTEERRLKGKIDFYTKEISRAEFTESQAENAQYATIPGAIAYFYYTGSIWVVLIGMGLLTCLMLGSERLVFLLSKNPYLCSFWSMSIAMAVASFGLGIGQTMTYYVVCFAAMSVIWFVQVISPQVVVSTSD